MFLFVCTIKSTCFAKDEEKSGIEICVNLSKSMTRFLNTTTTWWSGSIRTSIYQIVSDMRMKHSGDCRVVVNVMTVTAYSYAFRIPVIVFNFQFEANSQSLK